MVELHVTSLDVIHSFWAYQLGVKADANPNVDNVVFVKPTKLQTFKVRCAELCGIWHGYMSDHGHVVSGRPRSTRGSSEQRGGVRAGDEVAAAVQHQIPPRTYEEGRMTPASSPLPWRRARGDGNRNRRRRCEHDRRARADPRPPPAAVAAAGRLQPAHRGDPRRRRLLPRLVDRVSRSTAAKASNTRRRPTRTTSRCCSRYLFGVIGFLIGLGFANYPGLAPARPPRLAAREGGARGSAATSGCAPTTRSSASSTWSGSACSSSSPG